LPIQEPDRVIVVVDVPDRAEVCEVQDGFFGKVRHVVDDAVWFITIVPGNSGDAAVFYSASYLHFPSNHIIFAGSKMFVPGYAGPSRALQKNGPMPRFLSGPKYLKIDPRGRMGAMVLERRERRCP
jgi:hypothetical protein